jgi:ABC-type dipeptide/oligopeptide/nickel transport system ATPase component
VVVQRQILERLVALQRERRFAVLFVTHDLPLVTSIATRVGVMREGRLIEQGPTEELRRAPRHAYTRLLLSSFPLLAPLVEAQPEVRA